MKTYNMLILCTGNSARSVMAEGLLNVLGRGRIHAYSAGSRPTGRVNPFAVEQLQQIGYSSSDLRSKSWDEFGRPDAPHMDFIVTVCGSAAGETCPVWPGHPVTAHWGFEDPAAVEGSDADKRAAFNKIFQQIRARVETFLALPLERMDRQHIVQQMQAIGERDPDV